MARLLTEDCSGFAPRELLGSVWARGSSFGLGLGFRV